MSSVLIIDDAAASRVMLRHQLAKLGHVVIEAGSGQQALDALTEHTVDVVISDQEMPGMSGLELRSQLGGSFTKPFVLLTGYVTETEIDAEPDISPDAIITKPASSTVLASTLQELGIQAPSQVSG